MDLTPYVELLRRELTVAAEAGGEEARALAERLTAPLESAIRLTLLEALSAASDEITCDLAPGSVHVRLRGRDPEFVVEVPVAEVSDGHDPDEVVVPVVEAEAPNGDRGATSRINLRLPDDLKARVDEAADRERISVNAWLVRAAAAALEPRRSSGHRSSGRGDRFTGWVR
jgi:hypothetical protein